VSSVETVGSLVGDWRGNGVIECDIAIVGSGMGGGTLAWALRDTGLRVLLIERGPYLPTEPENWDPREVWMNHRYYNSEMWYNARDGKEFLPGVHYFVGGNTKVYGACLPRFRASDFVEVETADGVSPAWPITYEELEPYYARAEELYGVHGTVDDDPTEPPHSTAYPFPPLEHDPQIRDLAASFRAQGLKPIRMPMGVDVREGGRCIRCSTCDGYPCKVDAKNDADMCAIRPSLESPNVRLLTNTVVRRLVTDDRGDRVTHAEAERPGVPPLVIHADRFVVSGGAGNSAALLLSSKNERHPRGLANSSDQVGRNYMVHNSTFLVAMDPRRRRQVEFQKTLGLNDWYHAGDDRQYPLGNIQMLGKLHGETVKPARPLVPLPLLRYFTNHTLDVYCTTEDLPRGENRVTVDESGRIHVAWAPTNMGPHRELVRRVTQAMRAAGYPIVLTQRMGIDTNSHMCGTAVMGDDASTSVVTPECRSHDIENLWVVDSSCFPTSAAVNPALTIAAVALRAADHMITSS
jgi:choline dehydrogenase-like flavoprotein